MKAKDSEFGKLAEINYTLQNGEGFEFKIRPVKDIIIPDGTVRYKKGEFIQVDKTDFILTTDASGNAESPEFLYIGDYELVETKAPYGVVKLKEPIENLPDGAYAFVEFDASEGYLIDEMPVPFTIKNHGEIVKCQMTNKRKPLVSSGVNNPQVTKLVLGSLMISAISGVFVFERIRKRIKK